MGHHLIAESLAAHESPDSSTFPRISPSTHSMMKFFASLLLAVAIASHRRYQAEGHAYLAEPPGRSTAWRFGYSTPPNYNDNEINCGRTRLEDCGVCGDPLSQNPGDNVNGGKYGTGTIVRTYLEGDLIKTQTQVTANHAGWFEFAICSLDDKPQAVESCFVPLKVWDVSRHANGFKNPETKWVLLKSDGAGLFDIELELPVGFTCDHCVIRSMWNCGNDWGCEDNGKCCLGCGPTQEKFYACADISITSSGGRPVTRPATTPTTPKVTTKKPTKTTAKVTTKKATTTTALPPTDDKVCAGAVHGDIRTNPKDCCSYVHCLGIGTQWETAQVKSCPAGLAWNPESLKCDWKFNVVCGTRDDACTI